MFERPLRPDRCGYCRRDIVWGTLQNGRAGTFEREPRPIADVAPAERYAYSRRHRALVCLDGERHPPANVLAPHYCREYAEARAMRNTTALGGIDLPFLKTAQDRESP